MPETVPVDWCVDWHFCLVGLNLGSGEAQILTADSGATPESGPGDHGGSTSALYEDDPIRAGAAVRQATSIGIHRRSELPDGRKLKGIGWVGRTTILTTTTGSRRDEREHDRRRQPSTHDRSPMCVDTAEHVRRGCCGLASNTACNLLV